MTSTLNLRKSQVHRFWQKRDPRLAKILGIMEHMEPWVLDDHREVDMSLVQHMPMIEEALAQDPESPEKHQALVRLTAYLSSPRALRLLEWLDQHQPGLIENLLMGDSDDPCLSLLADRLQTLNSVSLLGRIFAPSRMHYIQQILAELQESEE